MLVSTHLSEHHHQPFLSNTPFSPYITLVLWNAHLPLQEHRRSYRTTSEIVKSLLLSALSISSHVRGNPLTCVELHSKYMSLIGSWPRAVIGRTPKSSEKPDSLSTMLYHNCAIINLPIYIYSGCSPITAICYLRDLNLKWKSPPEHLRNLKWAN